MHEVDPAELPRHLAAVAVDDHVETRLLVVPLGDPASAGTAPPDGDVPAALRAYPGVTVGVADAPVAHPLGRDLDVLLATSSDPATGWVAVGPVEAGLRAVRTAVEHAPIAARTLVDVLRHARSRDAAAGLIAESTAYSMLLAGAEFARWLDARPARGHADTDGPVVRVARDGEVVRVTLDRPEVHNAFDARMREELTDALAVAASDPSVATVVLDGAGPSFCAGGDLSEFGVAPDPAAAHRLRTDRGPARWLAALAPRLRAEVHGACIGAGTEFAAFAAQVTADPATTFRLPELEMGLIPGAGGTVSVTGRIGRQRTAWMALTGAAIDTSTALAWGLVDSVR